MDLADFNQPSYFLIVGPSGSGVSHALNCFSDFGFMIVGDVPPGDFPNVFRSVSSQTRRVAFSLKLPSGLAEQSVEAFAAQAEGVIEEIVLFQQQKPDQAHTPLKVLYLDAPETVLIQRYLNRDKRHPLEHNGLEKGVSAEKLYYRLFHGIKNYGIDTHSTPQSEMRFKIAKILGIALDNQEFTLYVSSFGFQYGVPQDAELMLDMRFITNPFYKEELRPMTGMDQPVCDFIFQDGKVKQFLDQWVQMLRFLLPMYQQQGKTRLTLSIGCTGGQHRSVCMTEAIAHAMKEDAAGYNVVVHHREMARWPKTAPLPSPVGDAG
jgi:RNase adapter protein RapZ